jgi:hypothetical protein
MPTENACNIHHHFLYVKLLVFQCELTGLHLIIIAEIVDGGVEQDVVGQCRHHVFFHDVFRDLGHVHHHEQHVE